MAYIQERKNKEGKIISYSVRVSRGYDANGKQLKPYSATFRPDPQKSDRQNKKALDKFVIEFEEQCRSGIVLDSKQSFAEYCEYVIKLKERAGVKHKTIINYRKFMPLVTEHLGHLKLAEIRPQHLNNFYEILSRNGIRRKEGIAIAKCDIKEIFKKKSITIKKAAKKAGIASNTLSNVCNGGRIYESKARAISAFLGMPMNKLFKLEYDNTPFSNKTILEYHRFISAVLAQADKELLIPYNPARKATPPKAKRESVNYFQIEDVERIRDCLENEPIKWKTAVHLLLITGARRGEICGLKWRAVDWKNNRIHICNNLQYTPDLGIYEESTKTEESDRFVTLPPETMDILDEYRKWYLRQKNNYGDLWHDTDYLFFQEKSGNEGKPMHPDTLNSYLNGFSAKNGLPHINPHAFRHTMASILYFNNVDSVSISKRLGHSKVSTTSDIYSHIIKEADERSAECIANVLLRPKHIDITKGDGEKKKAE